MEVAQQIGKILNGFQPTLVLTTANQLRIFDQLGNEESTAEQLAADLKLSPQATQRLLNALVAMGIASLRDDQYSLNSSWKPFLLQGGEHNMQQWIHLISDIVPVWLDLPRFVRTGKPVKNIMETLEKDPAETRAFIDAMHDKALKAPWLIAREIPLGDYRRMLDIGGGPGTYSLEWAKVHNHLHATIFDIPNVLEVAKDYIQRYGLERQVITQPGDFSKDDLGSGYDLILIANVLHMYGAEQGKDLVQKAVDALERNGRIVIHGFCTDEGETGPISDVMFSLNIGLSTPGGQSHSIPEKTNWLKEAGMKDIRSFRIDAIPTGVITGIKA